MGFFDVFKAKQNNIDAEERARNSNFGALYFGGGSMYTNDKALLLSAVYRAVEIISDSVAQLPFEVYREDAKGYKAVFRQHPTQKILNKTPNARMTRYTFLKTMVTSMLLRGNAYAYVERDEQQKIVALHYIPSEYVTIVPPKYIYEPVSYSIAGISGVVEAKDLIHILNHSYDGVIGLSTLQFARLSLGLASDAENHARGFFSGGCAIGGVLTTPERLSPKQKDELKNSWQNAFNPETGRPNSVAVIEAGMTYNPIGVNPSDSQLLETRAFSVIEVARWFGVSPVKLFDLSKSSYSTVEATNLSFLSDTIAPILAKFEQEFDRKIFANEPHLSAKFNEAALLQSDKQALADYYTKLYNIGVLAPNEIRQQQNLNPIEGGDAHFVAVNLITLDRAVQGNTDEQIIKERNEQTQTLADAPKTDI